MMYYLCTWQVKCDRYALVENGTFILFKRKRDEKAYFENANFDPYYEKVTLEEAKKLFGNCKYEIR